MKTRKQHTPTRRRAQQPAKKRGAARPRAAAARGRAASGTARGKRMPADGALTLAAECTVAEAESLRSELVRRLADPAPVTVDVSALRRIDTAGLQLLAAFVRDRRTAGRAVKWRGQAPALQSAAALLGLGGMLELAGEVGR